MTAETRFADSTERFADRHARESACRQIAYRFIDAGKLGDPVNARAVLTEHPEFGRFKSVVLDLAYEEYCQRIEHGESITTSQYCEQFPECKKTLRQQLEIHRLISERGDVLRETVEAAFPQPGDDFLGYTIYDELGRGAFARVFLATEEALGHRAVAIKVSLHGAAEADMLGKLEHANIVPIHSLSQDEESGLTVICMPFLGRATLCDVLDRVAEKEMPRRARMILDKVRVINDDKSVRASGHMANRLLRRGAYVDGVLYLALRLTEALAYAHATGILHLDLKPSNVLVTSDGEPMLLDFNLSIDRQIGKRALGGTLPYMSPEQLHAYQESNTGTRHIDERSDIFSLGVILYELLAGTLPFGPLPDDASTKQIAEQLYARRKLGQFRCAKQTPMSTKVLPA